MGRQKWPPSTPPSMMACLHVETPSICASKFKSGLQLCLQHRRSREQLAEQGIMPPLKAPAAFHERIRSLERARVKDMTGNFLKHKLCRRPARSELVRILKESKADASLQAAQMKLKRARLAEELNQKIACRPGPMELVEKNILPVDSGVNKDREGDSPDPSEMADVYTFTDDKSDALSPDPCLQTSPGTSSTEAASLCSSSSPVQQPQPSESSPDHSSSSSEQLAASSQSITAVLTKQSSPKPTGEKSRSKKSREAKPRIRKLKYHQYIPPDHHKHEQKSSPEAVAAHMDAAYMRILQQQQHFLQLQILGHQAALNLKGEFQSNCKVPKENCKPDQLPVNLDEMKVAELKVALKLRSLPVSGTKMDLIERLKSYHESVLNVETKAPEKTTSVPPKVSGAALENRGDKTDPVVPGSHEKDRRLREKELQIEELKRRLEREQRLVEELKLQLEVEKRNHQLGESSSPGLAPRSPLQEEREVKREKDAEHGLLPPPSSTAQLPQHGVKLQSAKIDDSTPQSKTNHRGCSPDFLPTLRNCKNLREPPPYEDAVKHTRMQPAIQGLYAASQQMDDLFDILIESGEMSPFLKVNPPVDNKRVAVTPSVTLLPVNTALSRPPPRVQVAHVRNEEIPSPLAAMEMELGDSDVHGMDWLDLSVSAGEGVFSTDFLDAYQLL
ncbi:myocardin-related transcription factor B isoform X3 [Corythoichthys intestinalis]|uniref:myocardin-related transcription factor B isoform X3 n=1 Tax=Corythoichthys intestinalis TaxID=161448 RepID=UPI0025A658DA|nr:myocardin-related transcription factor B isoform X3 [Corythoichthys intestinalis]